MSQAMTINQKDLNGLHRAITRNPELVKREAKVLFQRVGSYIDRFLATSPWRIGGNGGGIPYQTGELLRNSRNRRYGANSMLIFTDENTVPYARFVHDGTSKMKARPYYEAAMAGTAEEQNKAIRAFLDKITADFAK